MEKKSKKKFTSAQQMVVNHLSSGWELGVTTSHITSTPRTRYWIQEGKVGGEGKSQKVTASTVASLQELGVIKRAQRKPYPFDSIFELDREGLAALGHTPVTDGA